MADEAQETDDQAQTEQAEDTTELGDAGKRALISEREARKAAERDAKRVTQELEQLREQSMTEQEKAIEAARKEASEQVRAEMRGNLINAQLKAAATGRLADPDDALAFIDTSELDDEASIAKAVDALIERKPHLAASATRSSGFDAGARGSGGPSDMNALIRRQAGRR